MSAVLFQSMPPLSPEEYRALEASIREHGVQVPILVDENGVIIDGHHRSKVADELGIDCPTEVRAGLADPEKVALSISLNIDRRHLSQVQRRDIVAASLKADPEASNREHARRTGTSDNTVRAVRTKLEKSAQIAHFSERRDPRTGRATQPASKPAVAPEPKLRRRPIADLARDAGQELRKAIERVERLQADDRFDRNAHTVAAHLRPHVEQAIKTCQDISARF